MSFDNSDGYNNTSSTGQGFSDSRGGVDDPTNTGFGGQNQQRSSGAQTMQATDNYGDSPSQPQNSGAGAFGRDRSTENPSFGGSDSSYDNTATGAKFGQRSNSDFNQGSGTGQNDNFDDDNTSSIPGTGGASGGGFDNASKDDSFRDQDSQQGGPRDDQFGGAQGEREGGRPTFGDKMRGNVEKLAGTVSGKKDLRDRGEERKNGGF